MERGGRQSLERNKYSSAGRLGGRREGEQRPGGLRGLPSPPPAPAFGVGSEGSCLDPSNQKSPPPCLPHRPPAAASGKAGLGPADPRRRDPFSFLGGRSLVPGLGRGKMEILEKPGRHFSDAISTSASLGDACVALGLLDRSLTDAQMPRNQGRVTLHPFLPGTPPALVNSATICPVNSARNSARAAGAGLGSQLTSASLVEPVPSAPPPRLSLNPEVALKGCPLRLSW